MFAKRCNDSCRRITHSHHTDGLWSPSLFARKVLRQPIGQRAGGRYADPLAFELVERADRGVPRHTDTEEGGRPGGLADRSHGCTLGNERHLGARTDPNINTAGHHRLRHLAAASEVDDRQVESVFLEVPSLSPTLTGMIGSAFGAALPTMSVAAVADVHPVMIDPLVIANAASNRPRHRILTMVLPHLSSKLRRQRIK